MCIENLIRFECLTESLNVRRISIRRFASMWQHIRAQKAAMIPCVPSQDLIRLRKLNHSPRIWVGKSISFLTGMTF